MVPDIKEGDEIIGTLISTRDKRSRPSQGAVAAANLFQFLPALRL